MPKINTQNPVNPMECKLCTPGKHELYHYHGVDPYDETIKLIFYLNDYEDHGEPQAQLICIKEPNTILFRTYLTHCLGCGRLLTQLDLDFFWDRITIQEHCENLRRRHEAGEI